MRIFLLEVTLSILIIGLVGGYTYGLVEGPVINVLHTDNANSLKTYEQQSDHNLSRLYYPSVVREIAPILKRYKLNIFSNNYIYLNAINGPSNMRKINNILLKYIGRYK